MYKILNFGIKCKDIMQNSLGKNIKKYAKKIFLNNTIQKDS